MGQNPCLVLTYPVAILFFYSLKRQLVCPLFYWLPKSANELKNVTGMVFLLKCIKSVTLLNCYLNKEMHYYNVNV